MADRVVYKGANHVLTNNTEGRIRLIQPKAGTINKFIRWWNRKGSQYIECGIFRVELDNGVVVRLIIPHVKGGMSIEIRHDGNGNFKRKTIVRAGKRYNNVQLWDIDNDGNLDMLLDGGDPKTAVYWGDGKGNFKSKTIIDSLNTRNMQDAEFNDLDNDGNVDILILSSLKGDNRKWYSGYSIDRIEFNGRGYVIETIHEQPEDPNDWVWHPYLSGCDLNNDGDTDIVIEVFGQFGNEFTQNLDKVVFHNEINKFTKHRVISTLYLPGNFYEISKVQNLAKKLGISVERYTTDKTYFPVTDKIKKDKSHHVLKKNNVFHVWW